MYLNSNTLALTRIKAFSDLSMQQAQEIGTYCKCRRYTAGEMIISPTDKARDIFFIANGCVQAINILPSGNQIALQDLQTGDMFGELSALDGAPRSSFIVALDECLIISMSARHFSEVYQRFPSVNTALIERLVGMVRHLCGKVIEHDGCSARDRIRLDLLKRVLGTGQDDNRAVISPTPKHKEIAANACTSRESVSRELSYLEKIGVISRPDKCIVINDMGRLTNMLADSAKAARAH